MSTTDTEPGPLLQVVATTPTEIWNNSCAAGEREYTMANGDTGATSNPSLVLDVLRQEPEPWARPGARSVRRVLGGNGSRPGVADGRGDRGPGGRPARAGLRVDRGAAGTPVDPGEPGALPRRPRPWWNRPSTSTGSPKPPGEAAGHHRGPGRHRGVRRPSGSTSTRRSTSRCRAPSRWPRPWSEGSRAARPPATTWRHAPGLHPDGRPARGLDEGRRVRAMASCSRPASPTGQAWPPSNGPMPSTASAGTGPASWAARSATISRGSQLIGGDIVPTIPPALAAADQRVQDGRRAADR